MRRVTKESGRKQVRRNEGARCETQTGNVRSAAELRKPLSAERHTHTSVQRHSRRKTPPLGWLGPERPGLEEGKKTEIKQEWDATSAREDKKDGCVIQFLIFVHRCATIANESCTSITRSGPGHQTRPENRYPNSTSIRSCRHRPKQMWMHLQGHSAGSPDRNCTPLQDQ